VRRLTARGRDSGAAALELALILPVLVLLVAGAVDLGTAMLLRAQLEEAAAESASAAARNPTAPAAARQRAVDAVSAATLATTAVTITCPSSGRRVTARITYVHPTVIAGVFTGDELQIVVSSTSDVLTDANCVASP
jgi:Flp pilus assembly protein TadG